MVHGDCIGPPKKRTILQTAGLCEVPIWGPWGLPASHLPFHFALPGSGRRKRRSSGPRLFGGGGVPTSPHHSHRGHVGMVSALLHGHRITLRSRSSRITQGYELTYALPSCLRAVVTIPRFEESILARSRILELRTGRFYNFQR